MLTAISDIYCLMIELPGKPGMRELLGSGGTSLSLSGELRGKLEE